jgi:hypothetical protein
MKEYADEVEDMRSAILSAVMNTECSHPISAIIALSNVLCSIAVHMEKPGSEAGTDETILSGIRTMLKETREAIKETKVH